MRVLIADRLSQFVARRLSELGCDVVEDPTLSGGALRATLAEQRPHVLVVRSTRVTAEHLDASSALSLIVRAGAGVNTIAVRAAADRAIHVANCPGRNAVAVAELTMGHLINLDRRIADQVDALREGRWVKKTPLGKGRGLKGRTLAVLGVGAIGREVISRALAFGMDVRAWSRSLTPSDAAALGVEHAATPLDACRDADALTVHVALTDETRGLVDGTLLAALTEGAYVVNTARGGVVDQAALIEAVEKRGLRAGLDVFANEPDSGADTFDDPIAELDAVYGTHHVAASTDQARDAVGADVVRIVRHFLETGRVVSAVNLAERTEASHALLVRHVDAVGVLARVLAVLSEAGINVQEMLNTIFDGGHAALARIETDAAPAASVVAQIESMTDVYGLHIVALQDDAG